MGFARAAGIETHVIRERHRFDLAVLSQQRQITSDVNPDIIQTHNNKSHLLLRLLPGSRALGFYAEALGTAGAAAEYRSPVGARPWSIS